MTFVVGGILAHRMSGTLTDGTLNDEVRSSTPAMDPRRSLDAARAVFAGRYTILEELGRGAMGVVYRARSVDAAERTVALKLLGGGTFDQGRQFVHEANAATRVVHPNVVRVYEADSHGGYPFMAMEYVDGETLADALKRGVVYSPDEVVALLREVCLGLDRVHSSGLIHRDLKPSNLMLPRHSKQGAPRIKIVDFGIAIVDGLDAAGGITGAGNPAGTPLYMPPEAYLGHAVSIGADVYALGVIAYEMLSGKRPFEPAPGRRHLAFQVVEDQVPELPASVPRPLRDAIMQALAKDPAVRQASSLAFADALSC
jgi:serine/threonine protein kinase